jgi:hypothetical protein
VKGQLEVNQILPRIQNMEVIFLIFLLEKAEKISDINSMTDFLYAKPSISEGIGRNIDFFGSLNSYNYSENEEIADKTALASDLLAIYMDLYKAYYNTLCQVKETKTAI